MSKRSPHPARSLGPGSLAPFKPSEDASSRHWRRRQVAIEYRPALERWCRARGVTLDVKAGEQHWILTHRDRRAEWWPSSGRLVFDQKWSKARKAHDVYKLQGELARRWGLRP